METRQKLEAELRAIQQSDARYREVVPETATERLSYSIRQERRQEILRKIAALDQFSTSSLTESTPKCARS